MDQSAKAKSGLALAPAPRPVTVKVITVHQLMSVPQLAEWLQVSPKTIYQWVHKRQIPFRKLGHRRNDDGHDANTPMRFDYNEILEWTQTGRMPDWFTEAA